MRNHARTTPNITIPPFQAVNNPFFPSIFLQRVQRKRHLLGRHQRKERREWRERKRHLRRERKQKNPPQRGRHPRRVRAGRRRGLRRRRVGGKQQRSQQHPRKSQRLSRLQSNVPWSFHQQTMSASVFELLLCFGGKGKMLFMRLRMHLCESKLSVCMKITSFSFTILFYAAG